MEIKKIVRITNRRDGMETCEFDLKDSSENSCRLEKCQIVPTTPGKICYSGNVIIKNGEGVTEKSALLWVEANESGTLVYNE